MEEGDAGGGGRGDYGRGGDLVKDFGAYGNGAMLAGVV